MVSGEPSVGPRDPVVLAVVVKPHGLRGEVAIHSFNPDSELLKAGSRVWVAPRTGGGKFMEVVETGHNRLKLKGVSDRDGAEALRGAELSIPRAELPGLEPDELYLHDLIGYRVFDAQGRDLGIFRGLQMGGSQEYFVIDGAREVLLPADAPVVASADSSARKLVLAVEVDPDEPVGDRSSEDEGT